jgi:hypothetical protein
MLSIGGEWRNREEPPATTQRRNREPVPGRKRKVTYPPPKTATRGTTPFGAGNDPPGGRSSVASINPRAVEGKDNLTVGQRVRITASGLYSGESAVIERFTGGVIPSALVRTDAGRTRQVRTIDLEPLAREA